jgi:hypothetical protein
MKYSGYLLSKPKEKPIICFKESPQERGKREAKAAMARFRKGVREAFNEE